MRGILEGVPVFWIAVLVFIGLALLGGWWVDRDARRRGYTIHLNHTGLRRQVTVDPLPGRERRRSDDAEGAAGQQPPPGSPPDQNRGGSR